MNRGSNPFRDTLGTERTLARPSSRAHVEFILSPRVVFNDKYIIISLPLVALLDNTYRHKVAAT
jgi:hypothetical protein